ncbi:MAG: hypothetical protein OXE57_09570 [Alphaproteobacteria bacterium]|nr:hypothetical protein [Alphaproteobacteria bacterium]
MAATNDRLATAVEAYIADLARVRASGGATGERSSYGPLANLPCCLADYLTMCFPDYFARQACGFPGLSGRFHEAQAGCRAAVVASSRYAAPALRFGPFG